MHDEQVQQYLDKIVRLNLNHCKTSRGVQSTSPMKV